MQPEITAEYLASQGLSPTFANRFWAKVNKTETCWLWTACADDRGYGKIGRWKDGDPPIGAHVASWILNFGPVPCGMRVCHKCDNPPCVKPDHLFTGTAADNTKDMMNKGRHVIGKRYQREEHPNHKLTQVNSDLIRARYASGSVNQTELAEEFGVSQCLVGMVVRNEAWVQHVMFA